MRKTLSGLLVSNVLPLLLVVGGVLGSIHQHTLSAQAQGQSDDETCPKDAPWVKVDIAGGDAGKSVTYDAGAGKTIVEVCIKGDQDKVFFTTNSNNGCWSVIGIGTQTATAAEMWVGNDKGSECKDISHASFKVARVQPSPTPEVSPSPSPSTRPTPSPEPSVSPTPRPTPTPIGTPRPFPTPSPTPSVSPSPSPSVSPTPSPSPSTSPKPDDSDDDNDDSEDNGTGGTSSSTSSPSSEGQVLGATYAATGIVEDVIMSVVGLSGAGSASIGSILYAKKNKKI